MVRVRVLVSPSAPDVIDWVQDCLGWLFDTPTSTHADGTEYRVVMPARLPKDCVLTLQAPDDDLHGGPVKITSLGR